MYQLTQHLPVTPSSEMLASFYAMCINETGSLKAHCVLAKQVAAVSNEYYLCLVSHGAFSEDGHFCQGFFLQTLQGIATGTQQFPHKVELGKTNQQNW